jgi:hypothetical protein
MFIPASTFSDLAIFACHFCHFSNNLKNFTLHKIKSPSTFIDFINIFQPPPLFQPPRLVIWQFLPPLHVYSNLHGY